MIPTQEMLLRLGAATVLGGLIGIERERVESTVGLRTHAVVALGSALFMLVSMFGFANAGSPPAVVLDPSRVAAQIVTGIGFLGAGVIIQRGPLALPDWPASRPVSKQPKPASSW